MAEIVDHGVNGFQFSRNDPISLAKVMEKAAGDEGLWDEMVSALPAVPSMSDVTTRHMALYGDLIERSQKLTA